MKLVIQKPAPKAPVGIPTLRKGRKRLNISSRARDLLNLEKFGAFGLVVDEDTQDIYVFATPEPSPESGSYEVSRYYGEKKAGCQVTVLFDFACIEDGVKYLIENDYVTHEVGSLKSVKLHKLTKIGDAQ